MADDKVYVKNKDLYAELCLCKSTGIMSNELVTMGYKIAKHMVTKYRYQNSDDIHDCVQQAMCEFCLYWNRFNPDYPNAFAYVSQIIHNGIKKGFNKLHNANIKTTSLNNLYNI
jgi:hypothetical protein